ncbi:MAG: glycosyl transferase family 1 [Verrucomicrobia bacterium]|jgi:glycosyltransferase involved in cell wall biosynthesis|nr:glycosyl transferase family 1 [Verrucomicrobiota bacterium]
MKRVLIVDHVDRVQGGAELNIIELLTRSPFPREWRVACACPDTSPLYRALSGAGIECLDYRIPAALSEARFVDRTFPLKRLVQWPAALREARWQLHTIIGQFKPDILITCTNKDHFVAGSACRLVKLPHVWWVNDALTADFFSWPTRQAFSWHARSAARLVAVSDYCRAALTRLGVPEEKTVTIHNGIPPLTVDPRRSGTLREFFNIPAADLLFGTAGRFTPWKGQELFLELARRWVEDNRPGHFILIGRAFNEEQAFEEKLKQFVVKHKLEERVHFASYQSNLSAVLMEFDAFLHTSLRPEPFGRVLLEAMIARVPVIAANAGGVPEIINTGENGLLAKPGDVQDYFNQLERLTASETDRHKLAAAGRERALHQFTVNRVSHQFGKLLNELSV